MFTFFRKMNYSWQKSISIALAVIASISTVCSVIGFSIRDIHQSLSWWICLIILLIAYVILTVIIRIIIERVNRRPVSLSVNGNQVEIKTGDIFTEKGLKLIPFNEYFDTTVDDVIISKSTLNGIFLTQYINDIDALKKSIENAANQKTELTAEKANGRLKYPLGRIILYNEYLLLSFSHFNKQNEAHIDVVDYEQCLFRMWNEIRRTYSGRAIVIPLIGSGITTFDGINKKDNISLLKCILCTLKSSGVQLNNKVTIILTESVQKTINLDIIRKEFD